jgi:uncharacterized protein (UPF0332 family)
VSHLFNIHFVQTDLFSNDRHRFFKRLMKYRHEAEYGLGFDITEKDCNEWSRQVSNIIDEIKGFLRAETQ